MNDQNIYLLYLRRGSPMSAARADALNSQLADRFMLIFKQLCVDISAFFVSLKEFIRFVWIGVYFPMPCAFAVFPAIFDEAFYIAQRVTEEQSDFMREFREAVHSLAQAFYTA